MSRIGFEFWRSRFLTESAKFARPRLWIQSCSKIEHSLRSILAAVQQNVLDVLQKLLVDILVNIFFNLSGVDDTHIHAGFARVVQKRRVESSSNRLVPSKGKRQVRNATRNLTSRAQTLYLTRRVDKVNRVVVVLFHAGTDGKNIRVKDDILRVEANLFDE